MLKVCLHRADVDAGADHEDALRRSLLSGDCRGHLGQYGHRVRTVQRAAEHFDHRAVIGLHDRQSRGVTIDEQQRGGVVSDSPADRLCQRGGSVALRDEDDVVDAVNGQCIAQRGGFCVVTPCDTDRLEAMTPGLRAFPSAEHGRDNLRSGVC